MAKTKIGKVGMTPKGAYSNAKNYVRLDVVTENGSSYVCLKDCVGKDVTDTEYWQLVAKKGDKGDKPVNGTDYNTEQEKEEFKNEVVTETKTDIADYVTEQKTELNTYTETKKSELDEHESAKETELNTKAIELTNAFNTNATSKTTAYNDNATAKLKDYNDNATQKFEEYNENATNKVNEFNNNVDSIENELTELSKQMPWSTTEIQDSIHIEDSAKYSRNKLNLFGNLTQETREGKNLVDFSNPTSKSNNLNYTFENDILTIMQNSKTSYASVNFDILSIIKNNTSKKIKFMYENLDITNFTSTNKIIAQITLEEDGTQKYVILATKEGNNYSYTIPEDITNITNATLRIYTNNSNSDTVNTSSVTISKPMLVFADVADETYEKYGVTPSIDYPSMPQTATGIQKINRIGKNYLNLPDTDLGTINGVTIKIENNKIIFNGTATGDRSVNLSRNLKIALNGTYTFSQKILNGSLSNGVYRISLSDKDMALIDAPLTFTSKTCNATNTIDVVGKFLMIYLNSGTVFDNYTIQLQLEKGSVSTEFEPYQEENFELNLGNTELCKITDNNENVVAQDGIVYKENKWQFKKNIQKHIVDKSKLKQVYTNISNKFRYQYTNLTNAITSSTTSSPAICNIFKLCEGGQTYSNKKGFTISSDSYLYLYNEGETLADFLTKIENIDIVITYITTEPIYEDCTPEQSEVLNKLYKLSLQQGVNNIFVESENGVTTELQLEYMQDLNSKLNQLEAMIVSNASEEVTE